MRPIWSWPKGAACRLPPSTASLRPQRRPRGSRCWGCDVGQYRLTSVNGTWYRASKWVLDADRRRDCKMRRNQSVREIQDMDVRRRLVLAGGKVEQLWRYMRGLIQTHVNNEYLSYSNCLTAQIPPSYAANAYNNVQDVMFYGELVKLAAMWDTVDLDKISIPTIVELIGTPATKANLFQWRHVPEAYRKANAMIVSRMSTIDQEEAWMTIDSQMTRARSAFEHFWRSSVCLAHCVSKSNRLKRLIDTRARHFVHNFDKQNYSVRSTPQAPTKYGEERRLLNTTIRITSSLSIVVRNHQIDYANDFEYCRRNADELWLSCHFKLPIHER